MIELNPEIVTCAALGCKNKRDVEGEGKLFYVYTTAPSQKGFVITTVWLCENCCESWDVTASHEGEILLSPRERMAA